MLHYRRKYAIATCQVDFFTFQFNKWHQYEMNTQHVAKFI